MVGIGDDVCVVFWYFWFVCCCGMFVVGLVDLVCGGVGGVGVVEVDFFVWWIFVGVGCFWLS